VSLRVQILICGSQNTFQAVQQLPRAALIEFYRAWNITISFADGPIFERDPTGNPAAAEALCKKYRPAPGQTGHAILFMADFSMDGPHVNGTLLDPASRGCCAVFTESTVFRNNRGDDRFEVIAHEIGHMLNLVHSESDEMFPTAMNQWDRRSTVFANLPARQSAWRNLIDLSSVEVRPKIVSFFAQGTRSPLGLPMSIECQQWIRTASAKDIAPWGDPFRGLDGDDQQLIASNPSPLRLRVTEEQIHLGESIDCVVALDSSGTTLGSLVVPKGLGLREDTITLHVRSPNGPWRRYHPKVALCSSGESRLLMSGKQIQRSFSLLADRFGLLFPEEGHYELIARIPSIGLSSASVPIHVRSPVSIFAMIPFRKFLADGMPSRDPESWRFVTQVINDSSISQRVRAHLASERVSKRVIGNSTANARLIEAARYESPRSLQKNLLVRVARSRYSASTIQSNVGKLLNAAEESLRLDDDEHPSLEYLSFVRQEFKRKKKL
jgi:hypothetical protein